MTKLKNYLSITAGIASAVATFYAFLAPIWSLPNADKISLTAVGLAAFLSMVLTVFTGQKIVTNIKNAKAETTQPEPAPTLVERNPEWLAKNAGLIEMAQEGRLAEALELTFAEEKVKKGNDFSDIELANDNGPRHSL